MAGYSKIDLLAAQQGKSVDDFVLALLNTKKSAAAVAEELDMDRQTLYSFLKRRGYKKTMKVVWKKGK